MLNKRDKVAAILAKGNVSDLMANATMNTLEITAFLNRIKKPEDNDFRHDNIKRSVDRLVERGTLLHPPMEDVRPVNEGKQRVKKVSVYVLNERESMILVAQLSPEYTGQLVDEYRAMRDHILKQHTDAVTWQRERENAKKGFKEQSAAVKRMIESLGMKAERLDYVRESTLLWYALTGYYFPIDRENIPAEANADLMKLEQFNAALIVANGVHPSTNYEDRKKSVRNYAKTLGLWTPTLTLGGNNYDPCKPVYTLTKDSYAVTTNKIA